MINLATVLSVRTASKRLPAKALLTFDNQPLIKFIYERVKVNKLGGRLILATTTNNSDDYLSRLFESESIDVFRGSTNDLVKRHIDLSEKYKLDFIIRITGDCPFIDGRTLDYCMEQVDNFNKFDLFSTKGKFPIGIDFELINCKTLKDNWKYMNEEDKEHLTYYFYREQNKKRFRIFNFTPPEDWQKSNSSFTIDTLEDYLRALKLFNNFGNSNIPVKDLLKIDCLRPCAE